MSIRDVWVFYRQELRSALRERNIVIYSILLPLFLYPFLLWLTFSGITFVRGQTEGLVARVVVARVPPEHAAIREALDEDPQIEVVEQPEGTLASALRRGEIDAVVSFGGVADPEALPKAADEVTALNVAVSYDESKERSREARDRAAAALERYRAEWLEREAGERGIAPAAWQQFYVTRVDVASERDVGALLLKLVLPSLLLAMIALGCFYPAIDATAGERERSTWETTMTLAASRASILTGKYLYVVTLGAMAGVLNVVAMVVSIGPAMSSLTGGTGRSASFSIPPGAVPVVALGAVLMALFIGAAMMIAASFARTFKEGQTMVSPVYFVILLPVMFLQSPELEFTLPLALVPVVNVTMMFRDAIEGTYQWPLIAVTLLVEAVSIAACLALARQVLRFEDVLMGSFNGSVFTFVRQRLLGARAGAAGGAR